MLVKSSTSPGRREVPELTDRTMKIDSDAKDALDQLEITLAAELRTKVTHSDVIRVLVVIANADIQSVVKQYRESIKGD